MPCFLQSVAVYNSGARKKVYIPAFSKGANKIGLHATVRQ